MNPPNIWNRSHNHHHKNNSKSFGASIGSYPLMTTDAYARATAWERFQYGLARHPATIAFGYITIFFYGMCLRSVLTNPRRHIDSALSLLVHLSIIVVLAVFAWDIMLLGVIVPSAVAAALGAYLFYAQHNFPGVKIRDREEWNYVFAALHSSSYMKMGPLMRWFSANIGYHHVHHLNARIPFYRLPEAMAGIHELQSPPTISLHPRVDLPLSAIKIVGYPAKSTRDFSRGCTGGITVVCSPWCGVQQLLKLDSISLAGFLSSTCVRLREWTRLRSPVANWRRCTNGV